MKQTQNFTEGKIFAPLIRFALPVLLALFLQTMYGAVDLLVTVAIACVLNIIGDLVLVAGFHMGTAGAAIATVFAQAVSVVLSLVIIRRKELPFSFSAKSILPGADHLVWTLFCIYTA